MACSEGSDFVEQLHDIGVPVIGLDLRKRRRIDTVRNLARELRHRRTQIVHSHGDADLVGRLAARLAKVPGVVSKPSPRATRYGMGRSWRRPLRRLWDATVDRIVDRFVVLSREAGRALVEARGVAPERIAVIPNGIRIERCDPDRTSRGAWRARFGVPDEVLLVGGLGRLTSEEGLADLIRAFAGIDRSDVWLVIGGAGPDWDELDATVRTFDLRHRCLLAGAVEDVPEFLADLDLFVSVARSAGHSTALLEAMAMARPVIASDVPGAGDTILDGIDGHLVPPGDVAALTETLASLIRDLEGQERLGRRARAKVEREFTVERMVRRTSLLYEELAVEKGLSD